MHWNLHLTDAGQSVIHADAKFWEKLRLTRQDFAFILLGDGMMLDACLGAQLT